MADAPLKPIDISRETVERICHFVERRSDYPETKNADKTVLRAMAQLARALRDEVDRLTTPDMTKPEARD